MKRARISVTRALPEPFHTANDECLERRSRPSRKADKQSQGEGSGDNERRPRGPSVLLAVLAAQMISQREVSALPQPLSSVEMA
jgi:hypothetical protein